MKKKLFKKIRIKRTLAMILVFVMTLSLTNGIVFVQKTKTVKAGTVSQFLNDSRWKNGASWPQRAPYIANYSSQGCCAYCADYTKYVYGKDNPRSGQRFTNINQVRAGDVIDVGVHWFVVISRSGNSLYTAEGAAGDFQNVVWVKNGRYTIVNGKFQFVSDKYGNKKNYTLVNGYHYSGKPSDNEYEPEGNFDGASSSPGTVHVGGWALDRDKKNASINVDIYIGGSAGAKGAEGHRITANTYRKDVGDKVGCGNNHGFSATISTNKTGKQKVYAYGININKNNKKSGSNPVLRNCWTVNIKKKIDYKINSNSATGIKNKDATISGTISDSGRATKWGFYCGTNSRNMSKYTVSTSTSSSSTISTKVSPYMNLTHGTTYYYKMWAVVDGKEITDASPKSFTTTSLKPDIPTLKVASASQEIGIDSAATVNWDDIDNADYYKLKLFDSSGILIHESDKVTGTKYAFPSAEKAGEYTCTISAYSDVGTKGESESVSYTVHPDVKVVFKDAKHFKDVSDDYEPAIISEQDVHWGSDATKPTDPEHKGYTFKKWLNNDEDGVYTSVKEDITLEASYDINSYKVKYIDSSTGQVLDTKTVEYYDAAPDIDYQPATGFKKIGYNGWDKEHNHIIEDTTLYTCTGWYNDNYLVHTTITEAVREVNAGKLEDEGYTVKANIIGKPDEIVKGRLVVALKTTEGKLLTSTESAAFRIKANESKEIEVFVPYANPAKNVEVFVVGQYGLTIPISNSETKEIDQEQAYTNWSENVPDDSAISVQSRKEYKYSDKETVKSFEPSLEGYTLDSWEWIKSNSGEIKYVSSFPSGFNKSSSLYTQYNKKPVTAFENATEKRTVSTGTAGYLYWHWCRGATNGPTNKLVADCKESTYTTWHGFFSSTAIGWDSKCKSFYKSGGAGCKDSYWWITTYCNNSTQLPVKKCTYTDYKKQYTHSRWKPYSEWSTEKYTSSDDRKVEERTVYRYISNEQMQEDNSGQERTISGTLDASLAGKEVTLFVYKVGEASDYTNEYVGQKELDENGSYSFTFKLREEPTKETGDFTVTLGVEGSPTALVLDPIEAPKEKYKVKFFNAEKELISTQEVTEGENAEIPNSNLYERAGYTFKRWSATNVNIQSDVDIYAIDEPNVYNVVFVDWEANSVKVEEFVYGATLVTPLADAPEGKTVSWEILSGIKEGDDSSVNTDTVVTNNLVVGTVYSDKKYQVQIQDDKGKVTDTESVTYGKAVTLPEKEDTDSEKFFGWENIASGEDEGLEDSIVTENMIVCPVYVYSKKAKEPVASVKTGVYDSEQIISLNTDTDGASIYYTTNGEDPTSANGILYEEPIKLNFSTELKFYAAGIGMNNSDVVTEYYSINLPNAKSEWMTQNQLPQDVFEHTDQYNVESAKGYSYKNTKQVTTLAEATALEDAGWEYDDSKDEYTEFTAWQDSVEDTSSYIEAYEDRQPIYEETSTYEYSHYKYINDGNTYYSRTEVEGEDCVEEKLENLQNKLKISGFEDGKPYYIYDGQTWYNQEEVVKQFEVGSKYRYKYKKATYCKWSDWSLDKPSVDESREYKQDDVYCYEVNPKYLITVNYGNNEKAYELVEKGSVFGGINLDIAAEGKMITGLYTDSNYKNEFDYETVVNNDLIVYAKTDDIIYTVLFQYDEDNVIDSQEVKYGQSATPPEVEQREGYRFVGWNTDDYKNVMDYVVATAKYVKEEDYATVELDNETITLFQDKSADLTAIVTPNTYDGGLTWESSDTSVASVSEDGKVTAHNAGIAYITVKVNETGETSTCKVSVKTDITTKIALLKNSKLRIDDNRYLREVRAGSNTVAEIVNDFENDSLIVKDAEGNELSENAVVGTGATIYLMKGKSIVDQMTVVVVGDTSCDGDIGGPDVSKILRGILHKENLTDAQILAADVDGSGSVNARDASLVSRSIVGKETL